MPSASYRLSRVVAPFLLLVALLASAATARAGKPVLDNGTSVPTEQPYSAAQEIANIYETKGVYGKLEGTPPIDIYSFKPDRDGEQTFALLYPENESAAGQPLLIFVDPTDATEAQQLNLPLPEGEGYHASVLEPLEQPRDYREAALGHQYSILTERVLQLKKDTTYYMIVLDPNREAGRYVLKIGTGPAWTAKDAFANLGSWFSLQTDRYGGSSPFAVAPSTFGFILFLLGLTALIGIFLVEEIFFWLANKQKAAGYLLIRLQPYSKVFVWVSLWFMIMGGYIYFDKAGWLGIPFVLALLALPILVAFLLRTLWLSPRLAELEVTKREATIPALLRKRWFVTSLVGTLSLGAFVAFLSMYLTGR